MKMDSKTLDNYEKLKAEQLRLYDDKERLWKNLMKTIRAELKEFGIVNITLEKLDFGDYAPKLRSYLENELYTSLCSVSVGPSGEVITGWESEVSERQVKINALDINTLLDVLEVVELTCDGLQTGKYLINNGDVVWEKAD